MKRLVWCLALAVLVPAGRPLRGDDRDAFRESDGEGYVFILFDASDRMNLAADGSPAPRGGDDPRSRLWQAKAALFDALGEARDLRLGFATFPDQDRLRVTAVPGGEAVELAGDGAPATACGGWEPVDDAAEDLFRDYTFKWPEPAGGPGALGLGDVIPLSWQDPHHDRVRERLAPNLALGNEDPDFGIAPYFSPLSAAGFHALRDERARPFAGAGAAGLAAALESFGRWFREWRRLATAEDPSFGCRRVTLLVVTGGGDECARSPEASAKALLAELGVVTRVAALGSSDPALDRMAAAGGSGAAGRAADRRELASVLRQALAAAGAGGASYAARPVVSGVAAGAGGLFRSGFTPATGSSWWPGRLEGLRRPLPASGSAARPCSDEGEAGCRLWEAGEVLLAQAPSAAEAARGEYRLGGGPRERRVFWGAPRPGGPERRLLLPPATEDDRLALYGAGGMGLDPGSPSFAVDGEQVLRRSLARKPRADGSGEFLLGDLFHSAAVLIEPPDRDAYYASDLAGRLAPCGPRLDGGEEPHLPYPCFAERHRFRRRMLAVGANDGQLHVFDAGRAVAGAGGEAVFGPGSGRELFAFVPRAVLGAVRRTAQGGGHEYTVDGTVTVDDAVLTDRAGGAREWRTVLIGGLRGGGAAYYALDVTQPDRLDGDGLPRAADGVPSCLDGGPACAPEAPLPGLAAFSGRPFPELLWEFTDDADEDGNGAPDLGHTWSRPNTGRVRTSGGDRFVAIFGGGLDPGPVQAEDAASGAARPRRGNFLYMLDIGRGEILYKRRLDQVAGAAAPGSAPSEPAAVDLDGDGYLDTIYIGTTAGFLFRVEIGAPGRLAPAPSGASGERVAPPDWEPVPIFDTGGRPLFFPPAVIHLAGRDRPALAFGTGDRSDLWSDSASDGRLYVMLDEEGREGVRPLTEEALAPRSIDSPDVGRRLLSGELPAEERAAGRAPGWFLRLTGGETLLSRPRAVAGLVLAPTFVPGSPASGSCAATGVSRTYLVQAENGDPVRDGERFVEVPGLAPAPVIDVSPAAGGGASGGSAGGGSEHPCRDEDLRELVDSLRRELYPARCEFPGVSVDLTLVAPGGDLACLAPVPVCAIRGNWGPPP